MGLSGLLKPAMHISTIDVVPVAVPVYLLGTYRHLTGPSASQNMLCPAEGNKVVRTVCRELKIKRSCSRCWSCAHLGRLATAHGHEAGANLRFLQQRPEKDKKTDTREQEQQWQLPYSTFEPLIFLHQ